MENIDYKITLLEIISMIKDKSTYIKTIDVDEYKKNKQLHEGMQLAYHFILSGIIDYINVDDDLRLEDFGLDEFNPNDVLDYKPNEFNS